MGVTASFHKSHCARKSPCSEACVLATQMQSQMLALEDVKKNMEAQLVLAREELDAVTARNDGLCEQLQVVMTSMEEQCRVSVLNTNQEMSALQVGSLFHAFLHPPIRPLIYASICVSGVLCHFPTHLTG